MSDARPGSSAGFAGASRPLGGGSEERASGERRASEGALGSAPPSFELLRTDGAARRGRLVTPHGVVETPVFMPVGTRGAVRSLGPDDLAAAGSQIVLANTYHLFMRPGHALIRGQDTSHTILRFQTRSI